MAALKNNVKTFIVQGLACYESPSFLVDAVKVEFGITITPQQVQLYDPTKAAGKALSQKWVDLFNVTRTHFQEVISDIPIANKAYRLRVLDRMASKVEKMKNYNLAAQIIEQAAKECGDAYTNKRKLDHSSSDGSMTPEPVLDVTKLSTGTLEEILELFESEEK
ncbi:DUF2280 domain-containing protein [Vibrio alginolyticus]|uniref:DUF2280 domain-containing protein n=1 Tax=Vibrio alginolyticus TaxID=663 RepID=UPI00211A5470|nr:DUF2280 domain-containing protein [Vibrio alginolyticus]MCQ9090566.1 DUF2280 domain-containing protein [Vibrio alginolyticus]